MSPIRVLPATALALLLLSPSPSSAADTLTVVADQWCPYNCAPGSSLPGFGIEALQAIFEPQGIKVVYSNVAWSQALEEAKAGRYAAVIGASRKDVAGWAVPEEEVGVSVSTAFVKKGSPFRYAGPDSLSGRTVGQIEGYLYDGGGPLDSWIESHPASVKVASGDEPLLDLMRKALLGEVDVVFEDRLVFQRLAKEKGLVDKFQEVGVAYELPIYVGFSPARPESKRYAELFSQGIRDLRKSKRLAGILMRYGVADWKK